MTTAGKQTLDQPFVLVKYVDEHETVEFKRFASFEAGWKEGTRITTRVDREGSYGLFQELPSGNTRRRARFCFHRLTLKQVNRKGSSLIALALGGG